MAFGTAITVATLALGSRELVLKLDGGNRRRAGAVWTACALGGANIRARLRKILFLSHRDCG